jgi:hypothetical protein
MPLRKLKEKKVNSGKLRLCKKKLCRLQYFNREKKIIKKKTNYHQSLAFLLKIQVYLLRVFLFFYICVVLNTFFFFDLVFVKRPSLTCVISTCNSECKS